MSKRPRPRRRPIKVERVAPSRQRIDAELRASRIAESLRARGDWLIDSASFSQRWTVRIEGTAYGIEAHTSAFVEPRAAPGIVFSVIIRSGASGEPVRDHLLATPWFRALCDRLGQHYRVDEVASKPDEIDVVRVLRGTTVPSTVLREFRRVASAIDGRRLSERSGPERRPAARSPRERTQDLWAIIDSLRGTRWRLCSVTQRRQRNIRDRGCRWYLSAAFAALVESWEGRPGFAGMLHGGPTPAVRGDRQSVVASAMRLLQRAGYSSVPSEPDIHMHRWHRGLGLRAANEEIRLLERALESVERPAR